MRVKKKVLSNFHGKKTKQNKTTTKKNTQAVWFWNMLDTTCMKSAPVVYSISWELQLLFSIDFISQGPGISVLWYKAHDVYQASSPHIFSRTTRSSQNNNNSNNNKMKSI